MAPQSTIYLDHPVTYLRELVHFCPVISADKLTRTAKERGWLVPAASPHDVQEALDNTDYSPTAGGGVPSIEAYGLGFRTELQKAAEAAQIPVIRRLLSTTEGAAHCNLPDLNTGMTPLMTLAQLRIWKQPTAKDQGTTRKPGQRERSMRPKALARVAGLLVDTCNPAVNMSATDWLGRTAGHVVLEGHLMVPYELDQEGKPVVFEDSGLTMTSANFLWFLLENGLPIDARDRAGQSLMHYASAHGDTEAIVTFMNTWTGIMRGQDPTAEEDVLAHYESEEDIPMQPFRVRDIPVMWQDHLGLYPIQHAFIEAMSALTSAVKDAATGESDQDVVGMTLSDAQMLLQAEDTGKLWPHSNSVGIQLELMGQLYSKAQDAEDIESDFLTSEDSTRSDERHLANAVDRNG